MATIYWRGGVTAVKEKISFTPANVEIGDIFTVQTPNVDKTISYTAVAATVKDVVEGLQALCAASTEPEFAERTWTEDDAKLYAESDTAGVEINFTTAEADGGGTDNQTFIAAQVTANAGPSDWSDTLNWNGGLPTETDDVIIENTDIPIRYGLEAVAFLSLTVRNVGSAFQIGLPDTNEDGTAYPEWRTTHLTRNGGAITCTVNLDSVSTLIRIDAGTDKMIARVTKTGTRSGTEAPAQFTGTHVDNEIYVDKGDVEIAGTFKVLSVSFIGTQANDSTVTILSTATHKASGGTIVQTGGIIYAHANIATLTQNAGTGTNTACRFYLYGAATCASWTCRGAYAYTQSSGTITAFVGSGAGVLDKRGDNRAQTITTATIHSVTFLVQDPQAVLIPTNGYATGENAFDSRYAGIGNTWTPS